MRIAQIAPLYESVPPRFYGGTERVVAHLSDSLVARGHDVTLFASGDSRTSARLIACRDIALRLDSRLSWDLPAHLSMLEEVKRRAHRFDILHFHLDCLHLPLFSEFAHQTVTTLHGRQDIADLAGLHRHYGAYSFVSVSDSQRRPLPHLTWLATVHHGYPEDQYQFSPAPKDGYLAFLGRVAPEKGVDRAIEIARRANCQLCIAAKIDAADLDYYKAKIAPLLHTSGVKFIGELKENQKSEFLGNAKALLFPISWPEPFGLVMIEAMACGTPVVAFNSGSVPEIIDHGLTGFVVTSVSEAVEAVGRLEELDRHDVRESFERRFTADAMAKKYESAYCEVISSSSRRVGRRALAPGAAVATPPLTAGLQA